MASSARLLRALAILVIAPWLALPARAADAPVIETVLDAASGSVLWQRSDAAATPLLRPGQAIVLRGHGFGAGPVTAAVPGLAPPAGGVSPGDGAMSVLPSVAEPAGRELSKILFGTVRAMERNL